MKLNRILSIAAVFCTVLAVSCKKETPVPTGMTLDQTAVTVFVGQTATVTPTYTPSDAKPTNLVWTSSDEKVATVAGGYVKGIAAGTATITGKAQGSITATCSVTVKNVEATELTLTPTELNLIKNSPAVTISAVVKPSNVTFPTITWKSSDEKVATVDQAGAVTPVGKGMAVITASLVGGMTATCKVSVITGPEQVEFWKTDEAGSRELYGVAADEGKSAGEGGWLYWTSGNAYWKENTTGSPRTATLTLSSGSVITIKQCGAYSIAGDYIFYNYSFKALSNTKVVDQAGRKHETSVTFSVVKDPQMLNGHLHNLDLVGLYLDAVVPASIECTENGPKIYTYLTNLSYQKVSSDIEVAVIPELSETSAYAAGHFADQNFGVDGCNYTWPAWNLVDVFTDPKIAMGDGNDRQVSEKLWFCGFSVVKKGYATGGYTTIYQLNYQNKWSYEAGGAYFHKK